MPLILFSDSFPRYSCIAELWDFQCERSRSVIFTYTNYFTALAALPSCSLRAEVRKCAVFFSLLVARRCVVETTEGDILLLFRRIRLIKMLERIEIVEITLLGDVGVIATLDSILMSV